MFDFEFNGQNEHTGTTIKMIQSYATRILSIVFLFVALHARATQPDLSAFTTLKVNDQLYVMAQDYGDSSNSFAVVIGDDSAVLITTMMKEYSEHVQALIKSVTDKPVKHVISIDGDYYHYYGSRYFVENGATFVAHKNLIPDVFENRVLVDGPWQLDLGSEKILVEPTKAHTQDHVMVKLENSNVIFAGDALSFEWVVYSGPNGPDAHLDALQQIMAHGNLRTRYFPGNWSKKQSGNHVDMKALSSIYRTFSNRVKRLHDKGLQPQAIVESAEIHDLLNPLSDYRRMKPHLIHFVHDVLGMSENT